MLEMFDLESSVQFDAVARARHPVTQFHVFNGGDFIRLVKPTNRKKNLTSHCATGTPEGVDLRWGMLMYVVVQQIAILRQEGWRPRGVVVRADQGGQRRIILE